MNIIEAIQAAEKGKLITNNYLKSVDSFIKYEGMGIFNRYMVSVSGKAEYRFNIQDFSTAEVLSTSWEIVENKYFKENGK